MNNCLKRYYSRRDINFLKNLTRLPRKVIFNFAAYLCNQM